MKSTIFKGRKSGFTLAELLMVIAILVILVGLGVTGFLALRRSIRIAKYDDLAREIYVAVQNQLTRLEANGLDEEAEKTLTTGVAHVSDKPEDYDKDDAKWAVEKDNFYHADQSNAKVMALLLPLGAVADDVRSNGFYVVEYNVQTRTVYSVFYSEQSFEYSTVSTLENFRKLRDTRKGQKTMVGYYGGSSVERDDLEICEVPKLEIINKNELRLNILNIPAEITGVTVTISDGEKKVELKDGDPQIGIPEVGKKTVLFDSILEPNKHFHELFPTLTPGKDLKITVTYSKDGALSSSASVTANSLFATREIGEEKIVNGVTKPNPGDTVTIAWARHLQNLESFHSGLNDEKITIARQTEHIEWGADEIHDNYKNFKSIQNTGANEKLLRYEGSGLEIRDLKGSNGLFAETKENMELSGIRVVNPVINGTGTDPVGALVGTANQGTKINACAVYSSKINETTGIVEYSKYPKCYVNGGTAITGGLVGTANTIEVHNSFAALPRIAGGTGGTLIGSATDCTIQNSYANCDDLPEAGTFAYFLKGNDNTITHCYAVGNVANDREEDGVFADGNNTVTDSYYAVSHRKFAPDPKDNQDLAATEFFYIKNDGLWQDTNQEGMQAGPLDGDWSTGLIAPLTHPYREYLDGRRYPYPAIGNLDHYGSWPDSDGTVDLTIDMRLLNNDAAGYAIFAGQVQVIIPDQLDEAGNPIVLFNSENYKDENGKYIDQEEPIEPPVVKVVPGTTIRFVIKAADGYTYVNSQIDFMTSSHVEFDYEIDQDREAVITFQQDDFQLKGIPAVDEKGHAIVGASYHIDLESPQKTLVVRSSDVREEVETGSTVTVRALPLPQGCVASVVWYTPEGKNEEEDRVYLTPKADGTYSFEMPAYNTDIHVMYTRKTAYFDIHFKMRNPEGEYESQPDQEYSCGLGSQINRDMINAMAESSGLPLVIDGERVRYLAEAVVKDKKGNTVFKIRLDENGNVESLSDSHITQESESNNTQHYQVYIKIDRKMYHVTLTADAHINGVRFGNEGEFAKTVSGEFYYGASVTASADVVSGYGFSYWDPQDPRFLMSAEPEYTFQVPHFDLKFRATATLNQRLVTINLLNNGESWLYSDPTRRADPITLTLVNTLNDKEYPMNVLTEDTISYAMQAVVPAEPAYEEGYEIRVDYDSGKQSSWIYSAGAGNTDEENTKLRLVVRDNAVEQNVEFYSVTYFAVKQHTLGSVPKGGVYPKYYHVKVEGNSGYLRNETDGNKIFSGWKDQYALGTGSNTPYIGGEVLMLTRRTDMFAQWTDHLQVIYHAGEADGGELPVDNKEYQPGTVMIKWGSLTRKGYQFIGWAMEEHADTPYFTPEGQTTYELDHVDLNLYPVWKQEDYTLRFYDPSGELLEGEDFEKGIQHYGNLVSAPELEVELSGTKVKIIGWSLTPGGPIFCQPGENIQVTGNMDLYARLADEPVTVTYMSKDGRTQYGTQIFGKGISGYLNCVPVIDGTATPVTAWSKQKNGKGDLYFCGEDGRSEKPYAFTEDTTLYAVFGKVYNYNQQLWFDTLGEAVRDGRTVSGDTLIVYRDTQEPNNIRFNKSLYILASGNRRVTWQENATDLDTGSILKDQKPTADKEDAMEFVGCMRVDAVTVSFGRTDIPNLTREGSTLTFDANHQSRVIALASGSVFHMYDNITLTNGYREKGYVDHPNWGADGNGTKGSGQRSLYGGGVYAGDDATFYMHGGTISYCEAISGGGVYLFTGSKMYMGDMVRPDAYSATAIYYSADEGQNEKIYSNASNVTVENYKQYWVTSGNPQICYNKSTHKEWGDGGGGLLMLDLENGDLTLFRGSITNNETSGNGGGIMTDSGKNGDRLRIYEVDISHNTSKCSGGGIFQWQGTVYVYNSTIRQNTATNGGGIFLRRIETAEETSNIEFYYGDISDNDATEKGGGVFAQNHACFFLRGGNLSRNKAKIGGGAYLEGANSRFSFETGTVFDNTAETDGGGVYSQGQIAMSGGMMSGNKAGGNGGGIWNGKTFTTPAKFADDGSLITENLSPAGGTISSNTAGNYGGGIYNNGTITMSGSTICDNSARYLGGGIMQWGTLKLSGGRLYGNTDRDYAGNTHGDEPDQIGPNDIYLVGDHKIMIPTGGIRLSGEERVSVDCERDESQHFPSKNLPWRFAEYENTGDYDQQDPLYFTYYGSRSTEHSMVTLGRKDLQVVTHEKLGYTDPDQTGLYFAEKAEGDGMTSLVILDFNFPNCPAPIEANPPVNQKLDLNTMLVGVTQPIRPGYYLAGWARTPDALEEQYELFYDVVEGVWRSGYASGSWTNQSPTPDYTVKDYFSQTLYAMWKPCVAVYDLGPEAAECGVEIQPTSVGPKVTLLNPEPPSYTKDGKDYIFDHWQDRDDETEKGLYRPTQRLELAENLYLKAVWKERTAGKVVLTFYYNGGTSGITGELCRQVEVDKGQTGNVPADVQEIKMAYKHLIGWATQPDADTPNYAKDASFTNLETDLTLYAVWVDEVIITYDVNGGAGNNLSDSIPIGGKATIINTVPVQEGFDFLGWAETADATEARYHAGDSFGPVNQATTLYAVWRAKVTVTLMLNDGTETVFRETQESVGDRYTLPEPPVRPGYTFLGWAGKADATTPDHQAGDEIEIPEGGITLYALWEELGENQWQLIFQLDADAVWTEPPQIVEASDSITIPASAPTREGYVFDCWHDGENQKYQPDDQVAKPTKGTIITLMAQWTPAVTITFDLQGGTGAFATDIVGKDTEYTIPSTTPAKNGFEFQGWSTNPEGSGTLLKAGEKVEISENTTFHAIWEEAIWTVSFNLNGAPGDAPAAENVKKGGSATLSPPPDREGYKFLGWAENAAEYDPDKLYKDTYTPSADVTLYAIWTPCYKVTLDPEGGTWPDGSTEPKTFYADENDNFTIPRDMRPTRSGYSFFGWIETLSTGQAEYAHPHTFDNLTVDLMLKAKWNELGSNQAPPNPANSETQNTDPPETEAPPTEASAKEDPAASDAPAQSETGASGAPTDGDPGEVSAQPEAQEDPAPPEEEPVWTVAFYLDGVDFVKHPQLFGEELQDCQWDEEEKWLIYTVPAGEEVTLLPPEVKLDGWVFDGWLLLDENEEIVYPAGAEIPLTDGMALVPLWKEPPPPPTETQAPPPPTQGEKTAAP